MSHQLSWNIRSVPCYVQTEAPACATWSVHTEHWKKYLRKRTVVCRLVPRSQHMMKSLWNTMEQTRIWTVSRAKRGGRIPFSSLVLAAWCDLCPGNNDGSSDVRICSYPQPHSKIQSHWKYPSLTVRHQNPNNNEGLWTYVQTSRSKWSHWTCTGTYHIGSIKHRPSYSQRKMDALGLGLVPMKVLNPHLIKSVISMYGTNGILFWSRY